MRAAPAIQPEAGSIAGASSRLEFIDNLRWMMIVLVVSMHAAVTYSHLGSWYFMEDPAPARGVLVLFAAYQMFLQAFFMGLLFLIAGYFVPGAFDRKGFGGFMRGRGVRLGIPALMYMLVIQPITIYWLLRNFADPSRPPLFKAYVPYLTSSRVLGGSGPMWFALALLLFSFLYGVWRSAERKSPCNQPDAALPTHAQALGLVLVMALCSFLVRVVQPIGASILNMQLCYFSQYILLFGVGTVAWRRNWLLRLPYRFGIRWLTLALTLGVAGWVGIIVTLLATHTEGQLTGGWTWASAALCLWESFFCVGVILGLVVLFRDKFNYHSTLTRWLSDNSFSVYVFHPPLLIAVTLALRGFDAPKIVKFLAASVLGVVIAYLASSLVFRRIPLLKRVL
jgi:glucan biosynthesis protein C